MEVHKRPRLSTRLSVRASLLAIAVGMVTLVFGTGASGVAPGPYPRTAPRPPYTAAPDPIYAARWGVAPSATAAVLQPPSATVHLIEVYPDHVRTVIGGVAQRSVALSGPPSLAAVTRAVSDPSWLSAAPAGRFRLAAALVLQPGATLSMRAPEVTEVDLVDQPRVFIGANQATLEMQGVTVTTVNRMPFTGIEPKYRPFVVAEHNSVLDIADCSLSYLGYDSNSSYGVVWLSGSTGRATGSTFDHNFDGVFLHSAVNVTLTHDTFSSNLDYGVDPFGDDAGLTIEANRVTGNGHHGIILADHVTASSVRDNRVVGNAADGIILLDGSSANTVENNTIVGNGGDGLSIKDGPDNAVGANVITGNRVGLHIVRSPSSDYRPDVSLIRGNGVGAEGLAVPSVVDAQNGVHRLWRWWLVAPLWSVALGLLIASAVVRRREKLSRGRVLIDLRDPPPPVRTRPPPSADEGVPGVLIGVSRVGRLGEETPGTDLP